MKISAEMADALLRACDDSGEEIQRIVAGLTPLQLDRAELSAVIFKHIRLEVGRLQQGMPG